MNMLICEDGNNLFYLYSFNDKFFISRYHLYELYLTAPHLSIQELEWLLFNDNPPVMISYKKEFDNHRDNYTKAYYKAIKYITII